MGLDQYLKKRKKNIADAEYEEVAYWRKSNQIREWFVNHIEDMEPDSNCQYFEVDEDLLEQLVADCREVLKYKDMAPVLLPTSSGFFFGSTEYDEWYFEDLKETITMVTKVLEETDWKTEEIAYYEWW